MGVEELAGWLGDKVGLAKEIIANFIENRVDGDVLLHLIAKDNLGELVPKFLDQSRICGHVSKMSRSSSNLSPLAGGEQESTQVALLQGLGRPSTGSSAGSPREGGGADSGALSVQGKWVKDGADTSLSDDSMSLKPTFPVKRPRVEGGGGEAAPARPLRPSPRLFALPRRQGWGRGQALEYSASTTLPLSCSRSRTRPRLRPRRGRSVGGRGLDDASIRRHDSRPHATD